jgi:Flp pilus assembly protein TadG
MLTRMRTARQRGQAAVEFALTLIPFLMLIVAILEGSRLAATNFALANSAREGARAGRYLSVTTNDPVLANDLVLAATNVTARTFTGPLSSISTTPSSSCGANTICVCRHAHASALTSAACDPATALTAGSVIDVTVNYTFGFIPFMTNSTYGCLLCQATIPLTAYYRAVIE